eukprot:Pgem_evm1s17943
MQDGYDHSYYFISTFVKDHVEFHASRLHKEVGRLLAASEKYPTSFTTAGQLIYCKAM